MTLKTPNLDDRKFQDIVSEARTKIPLYCPKWTDYNLSDPGITLIEMFAWMVDMLLYRLNRVPDKNYIKFMELIGVRLEPPKPAAVNLTFRLSAPQTQPVTIPKGTEVATVRTETQDAISFATDKDFTIQLPTLAFALTTPDGTTFTDVTPALKNPDARVAVFEEVPRENNAFYLGFAEDLAAHTLLLNFQSNIEGIGVDPDDPPWAWEFWDHERARWDAVRLESDTTGGLNTNGQVILHIPLTSARIEVNGQNACWIRCRATKPRPQQPAYNSSPKVRSIIVNSLGCTIPASQGMRISTEFLGHSLGTPGQAFTMHNIPVLSREPGETVEVETEHEGEFEPWQEVPDFVNSKSTDLHFTCDSVSGEIQFGLVVRQPSGEERQYGKIPATGRRVRFSSYRYGGGVVGNVGEKTITVLKSSIPYIDSVTNFERARGGIDAETLDCAKIRAPRVLRANTRAVTQEDFEFLALEASPRIARARCFTASESVTVSGVVPGTVRLLLVPKPADADGYIPFEQFDVPQHIKDQVAGYLEERRLIGTRIDIGLPQYYAVSVVAQIRSRKGYDLRQVAQDVEKRLYQYLNPVSGGLEGQGWSFGRSLSVAEVYAALQGIPGVDYIEEVKLIPVTPGSGQRHEATARINVPQDGLICSHKHEIMVVQ